MLSLVLALIATPVAEERDAAIAVAVTATDPLIALGAYARVGDLIEHSEEPGATWRYLERVEREAKHPLVRARASFSLALRDADVGEIERARARLKALGFGTRARAVGPFANTGGASFGTATAADDVAATINTRVPGLDREVGWQTLQMDPQGELDLTPRINPIKETRSLFAVVVRSPRARPAALRLGSSGQIRAVWNGVEALRADVDRPLRIDQSVAAVQLERGDNLLWIELGAIGAVASVRARITTPEGDPITDLDFVTDAGALARAAKVKGRASTATVVDPLARARAGGGDRLAVLRAAVALESRTQSGDRRARPTQLKRWLEELALLLRERPDSSRELATVYARLGRETEDATGARRAYDLALSADPTCIEALLGLAELRREQGDERAARAALEKARAADPHDDEVVRAWLSAARDGPEGAAAELQILARARAVPTEGNLRLAADVLEERGDRVGAVRLAHQGNDVARVLRLQSDLAWARLAEDPSSARERLVLAERSFAMRPASHTLAEQVAFAHVAAGDIARALDFAGARAREYPERAEPLQLLARLQLIAGRRDDAIATLTRASQVVPHDTEILRALRALATEDDVLVARYGVDADALMKEPPDADGARLGAHVAAHTIAVRFFDNGLARVITDRVLRIHDAKKVPGMQAFSFPYSEGRERVEVLLAERITADGRRERAARVSDRGPGGKRDGVYTDVAEKIVSFGTLEDGDTLHVRVRKEVIGQQNLFGDFFGMVEAITSTVPVKRFRLVVEAPPNRALFVGGRGKFGSHVRDEAGVRVYDIRQDAAPPLEIEPGMPPFFDVADFVSVSTYDSWASLGAWYERLVAPQLVMDQELQRLAHKLVEGAKSDEEKVRRIYEYVVTATRYVGIELGIHGWKPYAVTEVHRRRYGDCKDKASLLVSMLREVGVPANLALVRTANLGMIEPEPASMWLFNHAIAYVPSLQLFLDGTAERSGMRELPAGDQGALSLIVGAHADKQASELVTIPMAGADANFNISDYILQLQPDGALIVRGKERFRGTHNAEQRRDFGDPATRRERLERQLSNALPGAQVQEVKVTDLSLAAGELGYDFSATLPRRALAGASGAMTMPISLYPHDLVGGYAQQSARKTDLYIESPWRTRNVMRYVLPPGMRVEELPAGGTVTSPHLVFTQKITETPDGFIVDEDTAILSRRIPRADYAVFRDAALRADALMKRKLRIVKVRS